jgi:hypothetical protein
MPLALGFDWTRALALLPELCLEEADALTFALPLDLAEDFEEAEDLPLPPAFALPLPEPSLLAPEEAPDFAEALAEKLQPVALRPMQAPAKRRREEKAFWLVIGFIRTSKDIVFSTSTNRGWGSSPIDDQSSSAARAAVIVASISASVCAPEMNAASN